MPAMVDITAPNRPRLNMLVPQDTTVHRTRALLLPVQLAIIVKLTRRIQLPVRQVTTATPIRPLHPSIILVISVITMQVQRQHVLVEHTNPTTANLIVMIALLGITVHKLVQLTMDVRQATTVHQNPVPKLHVPLVTTALPILPLHPSIIPVISVITMQVQRQHVLVEHTNPTTANLIVMIALLGITVHKLVQLTMDVRQATTVHQNPVPKLHVPLVTTALPILPLHPSIIPVISVITMQVQRQHVLVEHTNPTTANLIVMIALLGTIAAQAPQVHLFLRQATTVYQDQLTKLLAQQEHIQTRQGHLRARLVV